MRPELVLRMPRKRGRPRKPEDEGTKMVRVDADLAQMIGAIVKAMKKHDKHYTAAMLMNDLARPQVAARYERIKNDVEKIKRSEESAGAKILDEE